MFPSIEVIGEIQAPILVIHGTADELVPASMGQELIDAATYHIKQLALIPGACVVQSEIERLMSVFLLVSHWAAVLPTLSLSFILRISRCATAPS